MNQKGNHIHVMFKMFGKMGKRRELRGKELQNKGETWSWGGGRTPSL